MALLLVACMALGTVAEAQSFNKKKPKTTIQSTQEIETGVAIPGDRYGKYVWREVYDCKAKWYSDGSLKSCKGIDGTLRWRLETNGDVAERVFWDPGPGEETDASQVLNSRAMVVRKDGILTLVALPSGKQTATNYNYWVYLGSWGVQEGWYLTGPDVDGQPITMSRVADDGTVDPPAPHSDYRRFVPPVSPDNYCAAPSYSVTVPVEYALDGIPGRPWSELRRMALMDDGTTEPGSLSPEGSNEELCHRYHRQYFIGRSSTDGTWSILSIGGELATPKTYATPELAVAEALEVWQAYATAEDERAKAEELALAERNRIQAEQAAVDAEEARIRNEQDWAEARTRANGYFEQGKFEDAILASKYLPEDEWPNYVLAWHNAPVHVIENAIARIERDRAKGEAWSSDRYSQLVTLRNAINDCLASYAPEQRFGDWPGKKWLTTASTQRKIDMIRLKAQVDYSQYGTSDMHLAFDASAYEWVWISYSGPDVINIPEPIETGLTDPDGWARCDATARGLN
ncbi:MAG: hypothetical protein KKF36_10560 [Alphaproteobacteria bacterium]|nr:hypothetical protein [Alphaproteobacteria bacterium]